MATVSMNEGTSRVIAPGTDLSEILWEEVGAEIVEKPPMGAYENELASVLQELLGHFARTHQLGRSLMETLFDLRPAIDRGRRPDVAFVSAGRWPLDRRAPRHVNAWPVVPDLAIEVVSPSNSVTEIVEKIGEYFTAGVRRVWVVHPRQSQIYDYSSRSKVQILLRDDELDGGDLLPGFRLPLRELFEETSEA